MRHPAQGRRLDVALVISCLVVAAAPEMASGATGAWSAAGPRGGSVRDLEVDPGVNSRVWAATEYGLVYRSLDNGRTWSPRFTGIKAGLAIQHVAVAPSDPSVVYAGGYARDSSAVLYRTANGGATWTRREGGLGGDIVLALAVDPTNANVAYASTYGGVFKTTDGGQDWDEVGNGIENQTTYALTIRPNDPQVVFAGTGDGVYRTRNGGGLWAPRGTDDLSANVSSLAIDPFDPARLYAGTYGDYVWETVDHGLNWHPLGTGLPDDFVDHVEVDPTLPRLYALDRGLGIHTLDTSDPSATWMPTGDTGLEGASGAISAFAVDPVAPTNLYAGSARNGIARSTDRGVSWKLAIRGLTATGISAVTLDEADPSVAYAAVHYGDGVFRTIDAGASWQRRNSGMPEAQVTSLVASPSDPQTIYAGLNGPGVYRSTDGGASWAPTNTSQTAFSMAVHPSDPDIAWIGTINDGIFKTTDGGGHWDPMNTGLPESGGGNHPLLYSLAVSPSDPDVLYAGAYQQVFMTDDGAASWTETSSGLETTATVFDLAIHPGDPLVVYAAVQQNGVYRTTTGGTSWAARGLGGKDLRTVAIDPLHRRRIYAGSRGGGVHRSVDAGASWSAFNTGLTLRWVESLAISPDGAFLYAGTAGGGVFSYTFP